MHTVVNAKPASFKRNAANALTCARLAFAVPIALLLLDGSVAALAIALALFGVAGLTDFLDGRLARRLGCVSALGGVLDPLADKCVIDATVVVLTIAHGFPTLLAIVFLARDLGVTLMRLRIAPGSPTLAPGGVAKLKTCALYLGIEGLLLGEVRGGPILDVAWLLVGGAAFLGVLSALQYFRRLVSAITAEGILQR